MSVKVKVDIPTAKILKERGLGSDTGARKHLASEVKRFCEPYVPWQQGILARGAVIAADGSQLVYQGPYAHYQYEGDVYGPNYTNGEIFWSGKAPKAPTGKKLDYHGAPMRGPKWEKRMLADKSKDLERSMDAHVKKGG